VEDRTKWKDGRDGDLPLIWEAVRYAGSIPLRAYELKFCSEALRRMALYPRPNALEIVARIYVISLILESMPSANVEVLS